MSTIGVLGAGQLGRMLALAGYPLGLQFRFYDPDPASPCRDLADIITCGYDDDEALKRFARSVDVITYEFENVPVQAARRLQQITPVYPPPGALEVSQDRLTEKQFLRQHDIPTAPFAAIDDAAGAKAAADVTGFPAVVKTRRMGYDGKGQRVVRSQDELTAACLEMAGVPLILEGFVPFTAECSLLAVRSLSGEMLYYPLVQNTHEGGILRTSIAPAEAAGARHQSQAESHAARLMQALDYYGVLAIEYFLAGGELLANEIAPRVHNSGHWSIEGAETSQFENHLRAILGLAPGSTRLTGFIGMQNIIGSIPDRSAVVAVPGAHLHLYGKAPRANRKLGHVTVRANSEPERDTALAGVQAVLAEAGGR